MSCLKIAAEGVLEDGGGSLFTCPLTSDLFTLLLPPVGIY